MAIIAIYDWSMFTTPAAIPASDLRDDTHPNAPGTPDYTTSAPTWIGETFTFNGGTPTQIDIVDDDAVFEDAYVESGGAQTLAQDVIIDGTLYPAGSVVENEFSLIDASGGEVFVVRINGENVGFAYSVGNEPTAGESFTAAEGLDGDPADNADGTSSSSTAYSGVICFAAGTHLTTPGGSRAVETLKAGDLVETLDHGPAEILWVGVTSLRSRGSLPPNVAPVHFAKGSLGAGEPRRPLVVSPQHRLLLSGQKLPGLAIETDVLAPAKGLLALPGVRAMTGKRRVVYHHILLERHGILYAEGCATESFYPGPTARAMLATEARAAIFEICASRYGHGARYSPPARLRLSVGETRALLRRRRVGTHPA